jgi:hypothetical protein
VRRRGEESAVDADVSELMSTPGEEALLEELARLSIPDLRQRLRERKCSFGPIDARSRRVYERKLARLELGKSTGVRNSSIIREFLPPFSKPTLFTFTYLQPSPCFRVQPSTAEGHPRR